MTLVTLLLNISPDCEAIRRTIDQTATAFSIGPVSVKWYGLSYMAGLLIGWWYIRRLLQMPSIWAGGRAPFPQEKVDDLLIYMTLGVIIGGRLGSVLLYEPGHYIQNPLEILQPWKGGMAFHGALIGCIGAMALFAHRNGYRFFNITDVCAAAVPIGLMFGRLANFINGELYGRPTTVPWGMIFPRVPCDYPQFAAIEPTPRHPSQLYESFGEGLLLFLVLAVLTHRLSGLKRPGLVSGCFMIGYAIARSSCEFFFRQPDPAHVLTVAGLTPGIAYSIPMALVGLYVLHLVRRHPAPETARA